MSIEAPMKPSTSLLLLFICLSVHNTQVSAGIGYSGADINQLMKEGVVTIQNRPGIFTTILDGIKRAENTVTLPWYWVKVTGTTLSRPDDRKALASLLTRLTNSPVNINFFSMQEMGPVLADIINSVPQVEIYYIALEPDTLFVSLHVTDVNGVERNVDLRGYVDPLDFADLISKFSDELEYNNGVTYLELIGITPNVIQDPAVLDNLYRLDIDTMRLYSDSQPSHVFSSIKYTGEPVTWKKLQLESGSMKDEPDRHTIDELRINNVISENCKVKLLNFPVIWMPAKQEHDWKNLPSYLYT